MRFVLSALGSAGDVHPFIAIAQVLGARGHDATVLAPPAFADRIRRADVDFAPFGPAGDYEKMLESPELWQPRRGARFILDALLDRLPEAYAATVALATPDTTLVGSTLSWGVRLVQDKLGLPAATVHLSPLCIASADDPPVWPGVGDLRWMPRGLRRRALGAVDRQVLDRLIGPRLNAFRATLDLPPASRIWSRWLHSPDLVIAAWPDWFAAPQADWPAQAVATGFPVFDETTSNADGATGSGLDPALASFLAAGPAPVGITPGSAMAHGRTFIERAIAACAMLDLRAVVVTPFADALPRPLPPHVHHVPYAPFSALLPRLSMLVHHGGVGTAAQALAAGLPQVVAPFAHDQFDNAARLQRLRVAKTVKVAAPVGHWASALRQVRDDPAVATAVVACAARMQAPPAPLEAIADRLEALARRARPTDNGALSPSG